MSASRQAAAVAPRPAAIAQAAPLATKLLPNGLEIIVFEDHSVPIVTIDLAVRNGSFTEPPELNGPSHPYEHIFFKENQASAKGADYLKTIGEMGISYNGTTREEVVEYFLTTTTPNVPTAVRFIRDAVRYPTFNQRQFDQEREVVLGEVDRQESSPYSALTLEMNARLFYRYPSRKNPIGSRATLNAATTDMMRLIQSRYYVPNNMALVFTGDISPQAAFLTTEQLFGDWPRRPAAVRGISLSSTAPARGEAPFCGRRSRTSSSESAGSGPSIGKVTRPPPQTSSRSFCGSRLPAVAGRYRAGHRPTSYYAEECRTDQLHLGPPEARDYRAA